MDQDVERDLGVDLVRVLDGPLGLGLLTITITITIITIIIIIIISIISNYTTTDYISVLRLPGRYASERELVAGVTNSCPRDEHSIANSKIHV